MRREIFVGGQFAVAVLIEGLEGGGGVGDFGGVNYMVVIGVEDLDEGKGWMAMAGAGAAGRRAVLIVGGLRE
jgi:hypothetical protein